MPFKEKRGIILTVDQGFLLCPDCGRERVQAIEPDTEAHNLKIFCRRCKTRHIVDIVQGKCFISHGR